MDVVSQLAPSSELSLAAQAAATSARIIFIDPTAGWGGDGSFDHPYNSWYAFTLPPGDIALQRGGTVTGGFTITAQGTSTQGIVIGSYGTGQAKIEGTVTLHGASNVMLSNLNITGGNAYGVVVNGGTRNSVIADCDIHGGIGGVLISGPSSNANVITNNRIYENDTSGIWFAGANASAGAETLVSRNTIYRNGQQGISLHSSHVIIDNNTIVNNGLAGLPGVSAIHVYGESSTDTSAQHNVISNNIVAYQRDPSSFDGNGIQLDHWADNNIVYGNQVFGNDGAGINLLSAANNAVLNNTVQGNVVDSGGTHVIARAEIFVGEAQFSPGQTKGNLIADNNVVATNRYAAAIQLDSAASNEPSNIITGNSLMHSGTGPLWLWGGASGTTLSGWNSLSRVGTDDASVTTLAATPSFSKSLLDQTFTLNSDTLRTVHPDGTSVLVAYGDAKDVVGGPAGSWMAGDGRDNVLRAVGGDNLISAGSGNATLYGFGNDMLFGGSGNTLMFAGNGDTVMVGGSGNSRMVGGPGNDVIFAGNGSGTDILEGGGGVNSLIGGDGVDTFVLGSGQDIISQFTIGQDRIDVRALSISGLSDLLLFGDTTSGVIASDSGVIHAVLRGVDVQQLTAADFIFAKAS